VPGVSVRPVLPGDRAAVSLLLGSRHPDGRVLRRGELLDAAALPAFLHEAPDGSIDGVVTYRIGRGECELVSLDSVHAGCGVGALLLERVTGEAGGWGCARIWTAIPNDATAALRFLQRRGWDLVALHWGALLPPRRPEGQPAIGLDGIPRRHELEVERRLGP
jgi:GNAT superfamily N-acetyltransferase